mgnify:CR=1 FL=1
MSASSKLTLKCPSCKGEFPFKPQTVLRPGSPEVTALLQGKLNRVQCPHCKYQYLHPEPLLFRDDAERYLVYYLPRQLFGELSEAQDKLSSLYESIFGELPEADQPRCRLTVARNQFIEKLVIHQHGLDDRLVEYVKYQLFQHSPGLDAAKHDVLYDFQGSTPELIQFVVFERDNGQPQYALSFQRAAYEELRAYFLGSPEMEAELNDLFPPRFVHVEELVRQ